MPRRLPRAGRRERRRARGVPARAGRPPARERDRARRRPARSSTSAAASRTSTSSRGSAAPAARSRPASRRRRAAARAARSNGVLTLGGEPLTCERIKLEVERASASTARRRGVHRLARRADRRRPRRRLRPDRRRRRRPLRPLPARPRVGLLRGLHAHVLARRPPGRAARVPPAREGGARPRRAAVKPGVKGSDIHRQVCDFFHEHGHKTQLHKEEGEVARRRLLPRDRPRRRARGARAPGVGRSRASRSSRAT